MTSTATLTTPAPAATSPAADNPRPRLWLRLSIARGNLLQAVGITAGAALLAAAAAADTAPGSARFALALLGWLAIYDCTHSIGHYLAGRAVGIRFRFYGVRGTDHPEDYPQGFRQLMSVAPFWSVITDKTSMRTAAPWRKAVMFAAGETSTAACSLGAAYAIAATHVPGGSALFAFTVVWNAASTIVTAIKPKGDYAKAIHALRPLTHHIERSEHAMPTTTVIDLATRIQRRRDFAAHLTGFLTGALTLTVLHFVDVDSTTQLVATMLVWATALSFQHFRHVMRGPVTTTEITREHGRLQPPST